MVRRTETAAAQPLDQLFEQDEEAISSLGDLVVKYNGARLTGTRRPSYERIADMQVSPTDVDATPMRPSGGGSSVLGYHDHYVVDGGKARIILSALTTPASIMDNTPMLDLVDWVCSRWRLTPKIAVADAKYGTVPNIVGLEERGIKAFLPIPDLSKRNNYYPRTRFDYDVENDQYICPQGQPLPLHSRRQTEQVLV